MSVRCRLGIHKVQQITFWEYQGYGDRVVQWCDRDCGWRREFYTMSQMSVPEIRERNKARFTEGSKS
jgi:hypothetical protein